MESMPREFLCCLQSPIKMLLLNKSIDPGFPGIFQFIAVLYLHIVFSQYAIPMVTQKSAALHYLSFSMRNKIVGAILFVFFSVVRIETLLQSRLCYSALFTRSEEAILFSLWKVVCRR